MQNIFYGLTKKEHYNKLFFIKVIGFNKEYVPSPVENDIIDSWGGSISYRRDITELLVFSFSIRYGRSRFLTAGTKINHYSLITSAEYQVADNKNVNLEYTYTKRINEDESGDEEMNRNTVKLGFTIEL